MSNDESSKTKEYPNSEVNFKAISLKPDFKDLNNPATIIEHVKGLNKTIDSESKTKENLFPVHVFPNAIQQIIISTNESLNYPKEFIGASILFAASVAIGNTHRVEIMKNWQENAVLYLSLVGRRGTIKSHPISFALKPFERWENLKFQKYLSEKLEYDAVQKLTQKEKENQGIDEPKKPILEQLLVIDFTPEALAEIHYNNKRGLGVYSDELASWFKNFNRYNKGSQEQFWLSVWSGKLLRINRKTSDPIYIPLPSISVIGTIQPGILNELAENRTENGFLDRLLFAVPDNLKKEYWSETELNPSVEKNWQTIISNLLELPLIQDDMNNPRPEILRFTPEAKRLLFDWQRELTDESNKPENEGIIGTNAKIEMYAIRLALILQMLRYACSDDGKQEIGKEAVEGALQLAEYFKKTAVIVHSIVSDPSPLDKLPADKQILYKALPDNFTTSEGVKVADSMGIAERTFKRFLSNRELFANHKRGEYEKRY